MTSHWRIMFHFTLVGAANTRTNVLERWFPRVLGPSGWMASVIGTRRSGVPPSIVTMSIHADLDADKNHCTSNDLVSRVDC